MRTAVYEREADALNAVAVLAEFDVEAELHVEHDSIPGAGNEPAITLYEVRVHELPTRQSDAPRLALVEVEPHEDDFQESTLWDATYRRDDRD